MTICRNLGEFLDFTDEQRANITELNLRKGDIDDAGATALAGVLQDNTTLTLLNLYNNNIGDKGASALAGVLQGNRTLISFYLGSNQIGDEGASVLSEAIQDNTSLTSLDLCFNQIGYEASKLIQAFESRNLRIHEKVLDALAKIAKGGDVVDIDISKIKRITHIEGINPIINPLDAYLQNPSVFNREYTALASNEILQQLVIIFNEEGNDLASNAIFQQLVSARNLSQALPLTKVEKMSALHSEDFLKMIGKFLTKKDAARFKATSKAPEQNEVATL